MRVLLPFLALYRRHSLLISLGILWRSSLCWPASACWHSPAGSGRLVAGRIGGPVDLQLHAAGRRRRGAAISRTAGRYAERVVSHDATFRVLSHLRVFTFSKILPLTPGGVARFRRPTCSTARWRTWTRWIIFICG